ncbi:hypothetical protein KY346_00240 [Candidatus Woesearchaeota archaeon]|nr:hypothetical protein [Candidatus Woesearchaeota archaeon]
MNKKAALQLSINAIVILILAITILGLGLGFIKSQFGALTEQFGAVSAEIKTSLIEKIKESGELLVFNRAEISAKVGKPEEFYIGVKNTVPKAEGSVCFRLGVKCIRALSPDNTCPGGGPGLVGGMDVEGIRPDTAWFSMFDQVDIKPGDVGVFPIKLQIASAIPDTYLMEFNVYKDGDDSDCEMAAWGVDSSIYQSKQFFIKVT